MNGAAQDSSQPMRFAFSWPLLGLVLERPSYGYELLQRFQRIYGDTLTLRVNSTKRIYEALEELQDRGLIEQTTEPATPHATRRMPKTTYTATATGIAAYQDWLVGQVSTQRRDSSLFARHLSRLQAEQAIEVIDRYEQECLEATAKLPIAPPTTPEHARASETGEALIERLAQEDDRLALNARLTWCEYARRELQELQAQEAQEPADNGTERPHLRALGEDEEHSEASGG